MMGLTLTSQPPQAQHGFSLRSNRVYPSYNSIPDHATCALIPKNVSNQPQDRISQHTTCLVPHTGFEPIRPRSIMDTASNSGSASALFRQQGFKFGTQGGT